MGWNIHLPAILGFTTRYQGFDPSPIEKGSAMEFISWEENFEIPLASNKIGGPACPLRSRWHDNATAAPWSWSGVQFETLRSWRVHLKPIVLVTRELVNWIVTWNFPSACADINALRHYVTNQKLLGTNCPPPPPPPPRFIPGSTIQFFEVKT